MPNAGIILSDLAVKGIFSLFLPSSLLWKVSTREKVVYLTFDDGPIPGLTVEILSILEQYNAPATFFCVGENVKRHPDIYREILKSGHAVGNHSHHHIKGWGTEERTYLDDIGEASEYIDSNLFRPPYGLMSWRQANVLTRKYRVVMWTVLTRDYDPSITPAQCLKIAVGGVKPGAIIVFHDNMKARENVLYALPLLLEHLKKEGFRCEKLCAETFTGK